MRVPRRGRRECLAGGGNGGDGGAQEMAARAIVSDPDQTNRAAPSAGAGFPGSSERRASDAVASIALIGHELRTPLSALHATVEVLADYPDLDAEDVRYLVRRLQLGLAWMEDLVDNLTAWAQIDSGTLRLDRSLTKVGECVAAAAAIVEPFLERKEQHLAIRTPATPPVVLADARLLVHALVNLMTNASAYGPANSPIDVVVSDAAGTVEVRVTDRGPGIAADEQAAIFERGVRGRDGRDGREGREGAGSTESSARAGRMGLGLGLHVVKRIVELHGGTAGVDSVVGHGASFWFRLATGATGGNPQ
jgi:signal transduction histidine kinase